jgi:hypothetical protein
MKKIKNLIFMFKKIKMKNITKAYNAAWAFIPSIILKALINNRKQRVVTEIESEFNNIFCQ